MNNNRQSDKLGEWTELDLTELDQIFGGHRWFENGFKTIVSGDKAGLTFVFSTTQDEWDGEEPDGGEFYNSAEGVRKRWVVGKHIFDWQYYPGGLTSGGMITFMYNNEKWGRLLYQPTIKGGLFSKGPLRMKGNGSKMVKL